MLPSEYKHTHTIHPLRCAKKNKEKGERGGLCVCIKDTDSSLVSLCLFVNGQVVVLPAEYKHTHNTPPSLCEEEQGEGGCVYVLKTIIMCLSILSLSVCQYYHCVKINTPAPFPFSFFVSL